MLGTDGLFKNLRYEDVDALRTKLRSQKEIEAVNNWIVQLVTARGREIIFPVFCCMYYSIVMVRLFWQQKRSVGCSIDSYV